jgi:hypothetical protein
VTDFGRRTKTELVSQPEARSIARRCGCILRGLGGTQDGVIGALAGIGLAATGEDGRFIFIGTARDLQGAQTVQAILGAGIAEVRTIDGRRLDDGLIDTGGKLRPAFREGRPILFVTRQENNPSLWIPVKLD